LPGKITVKGLSGRTRPNATELRVERQAAVATMAYAQALLGPAAAIGLRARLDQTDTSAWRDVAATRITG
jgi:hypothetical protein